MFGCWPAGSGTLNILFLTFPLNPHKFAIEWRDDMPYESRVNVIFLLDNIETKDVQSPFIADDYTVIC